IAPRSATASTATEPGMPLAMSVVPSMGSTATSHQGPSPLPTSSPLNSMGASSFSPSPITTMPRMETLPMSRRIASTAAPSPPFLSPRPTHRPAAIAAASVTRTSSIARLRSGASRRLFDVGMGPPSLGLRSSQIRRARGWDDGHVGEPLEKPPRSAMTVRHMVAAVGVMLLVVLVLGFLSSGASFTPGGPVSEPSTARVVDAPAQLRALTAPFPVRVPATPAGWRSNSVGTDDVAGRKAIRAGYLTPSAGYLQLQQSDATEEALLAAIGERPAQGAQDVGGARWVVYGARPAEPVWIADVKG